MAKGKGKAKGRGKAKSTAKASMRLALQDGPREADADADAILAGPCEGALVPFAKAKKPRGALTLKRVLEALGDKSLEDGLADAKAALQVQDGVVRESIAMDDAHAKHEEDAKKEFEVLQAEVDVVISQEVEAAAAFRATKGEHSSNNMDKLRLELFEHQKKLAMLEFLALNRARMKEFEDQRLEAMEALAAATKNMIEQRQKEKEALEATKRALVAARAGARDGGRKQNAIPSSLEVGRRRVAADSEAEAAPIGGEDTAMELAEKPKGIADSVPDQNAAAAAPRRVASPMQAMASMEALPIAEGTNEEASPDID